MPTRRPPVRFAAWWIVIVGPHQLAIGIEEVDEDHLVFEAYSTDYQRPAQLKSSSKTTGLYSKPGPA